MARRTTFSSQQTRTDAKVDELERLPDELCVLVLDQLDLIDIVRVSHVSRRLRACAHAHTTFSGDIDLTCHNTDGPSDAQCDFFRARVNAPRAGTIRQLTINVFLTFFRLETRVLPLISQCLPRLLQLHIIVHESYSTIVLDALARPAPLLQRLYIGFRDASHPMDQPILQFRVPCPVDIFGGDAPHLHDLDISSMRWPMTTVPAFRAVTVVRQELDCRVRPSAFDPRAVFLACPNVTEISFGWATEDGDEPADFWDLCQGHWVDNLWIYGRTQSSAITVLTTAATTAIAFDGSTATGATFAHVFSHFPGALRMAASCTDRDTTTDSLIIALTDDVRTRKVSYYDDDITDMLFPAVFAPIAHLITLLSLDMLAWRHQPRIATYLPAVDTLVLNFSCDGEEEDWPDANQRLTCPALARVEIHGPADDLDASLSPIVEVRHLAQLMGRTLGCVAQQQLVLAARGAILVGNPREIHGYFREIHI